MQAGHFKTLFHLCLFAGFLMSMPARAVQQEYQIDSHHSTLTQGLDDWYDWRLYWRRVETDHDWLYAEYLNWNRFGLNDTRLGIGRRFHIRDSLKYMAELHVSENNTLFPAYSLYGGVETKLNPQTILTAGLRHSHFRKRDPLTSTIKEPESEALNARIEYYFGNSMVSYSLFYTLMHDPDLSDHVSSQSLKYLYTYQTRSTVFISADSGGDIDYEPTTTQLAISQIDSLTVGGNHWLSGKLALVYTVGKHRVSLVGSGFDYQRNVVYLGLRKLTR
jgi:YaiO family outer membrane protein